MDPFRTDNKQEADGPLMVSQQPLSLMTINLNPNRKEDQLIMRVLEASERKMQLIRRLLTPEEFESLAFDQYDFNENRRANAQPEKLISQSADTTSMDVKSQYAELQKNVFTNSSLSLDSKIPAASKDLRGNLVKKREALEFFFREQVGSAPKRENLAIELRSGYYLSSRTQTTSEIIKDKPFSLMDRVFGLLGFIGISWQSSRVDLAIGGHQLDEFSAGITKCEPYTRQRNLDTMKSRLETDGELDKILKEIREFDQWPEHEGSRLTNLMDLAKMHKKHLVSSKSLESQVKLVQPVGYFNTIQLIGPQKLQFETSLVELLLSEPKPPKIMAWLGVDANSPKDMTTIDTSQLRLHEDTIQVRLSNLVILDHKLMSEEERLALKAIKLIEKEKSLQTAESRLFDQLDNCIKVCPQDVAGDFRRTLENIFESILDVSKEVLTSQQELLTLASELQSLRAEQKFISTTIEVKASETGTPPKRTDWLTKLVGFIEANFSEHSQEVLDSCRKFSENYEKQIASQQPVELISMMATPNDECPIEEATRRQQMRAWLDSLQLKVLIGDRYFYQLNLEFNESTGLIYLFDLIKHDPLTVPFLTEDGENIELSIELYANTDAYQVFTLAAPGVAARARVVLPRDTAQSHRTALQFTDESALAELKLESSPMLGHLQSQRGEIARCKSPNLLDKIHRKIFRHTQKNSIGCDLGTKFSQLLNRCDYNVLVQLLGHRAHSHFVLDPFIDYMDETPHRTSTHHALLLWRWLNDVQQVVYLSERENLKHYSLRSEEFKSKLEAIVVDRHERGYRVIEQVRSCAVNYIKEYEAHLKEILKYRANERAHQRKRTKVFDMLREPEIKLDLSGVVRTARSFVPKRSAHRPLLPKRKGDGTGHPPLSLVKTSLLSQAADAEAQDFAGHWHRLTSSGPGGPGRLQLVVTIQQANNLPMRVIQARPISPSPRPTSPFGPTSTPNVSFMSQLIQPVTGQYLAPPTTYVEIVFQRRQQASSLAQGKNPAWNETLFFPVEVGNNPMDGISPLNEPMPKEQLVDEHLQLNLYDYHCYVQDSTEGFRSESELPTMAATDPISGLGLPGANNPSLISAQRIQSAKQRIERHLLGSLRVPLSTLMSSGRIEGSFALNQPLLLESYQFEPEVSLTHDVRAALAQRANTPPGAQDSHTKRSPEMHISLFITLDPPVSVPVHLLHLPIDSYESDQVHEMARLWELVVVHHRQRSTSSGPNTNGTRPFAGSKNRHHPHRVRQNRHIRALVMQRDAKYCLICRLIVPLRPPAELLESRTDKRDSMRALARFVALLSPLKYGLFGMRFLASSLWFDSAQLIDQCLGGPEEKAVLLCNYFLHLGITSAMLLGDAVPEGRCVYVITWHEQSRFIDDQLQLQANTLLESLSNLASGQTGHELSGQFSTATKPIQRSDFIARLPILMNANAIQLWDPTTGKPYSLKTQIPLVSVGSIVTMENIYANIQSVESPTETNYDIRLKHLWYPLFLAGTSMASGSVRRLNGSSDSSGNGGGRNLQMNWRRQLIHLENMRKSIERPQLNPLLSPDVDLNYSKFTPEECNELREVIERTVKSYLLRWRPDRPTYFNRTLSRLLAEKLELFESYIDTTGDHKPDWRNELADLIKDEVLMAHLSTSGLNARQVISCPINLPYTSMRAIVDSIFASGVHNADLMFEAGPQQPSSSTQFLVACYVYPYPARVLSIWLYVAAVIPNTRSQTRLQVP